MKNNPQHRAVFLVNDNVHILDMAGPVQAFYESGTYGIPYETIFVSNTTRKNTSSDLMLANLKHFSKVKVRPTDIIFIPGFENKYFRNKNNHSFYAWLQAAHTCGATICSVCTGAFLLAEAGLLDNIPCTTHWRYTDRLQKEYPDAKVISNKLFVKSDNIYTSAGICTGIDLALFLLEERHGAAFTFKVAREMVVYMRRDGDESQESFYLQYRQHIKNNIHYVQDWIIENIQRKITLNQLSALVHTSPRNFTRLFKSTTGISAGQYIEKLRAERAVQLLKGKDKLHAVANDCGLKSVNQLRSIIKKNKGALPSDFRGLS